MSQWADAERRLSRESSAEAGRWNTTRAPYQRGMMDAVADPSVEKVVFKTSAQIGKTSILENIVGFFIDRDPSPILVLQPTLEMAETFSKDRLAPMIRDTPALRGKVHDAKSRTSGQTILHKRFTGGHVTMAGANSPSSLASRPIRVLLMDEADRYPASAGTEGDPIRLAEARTKNYWNRKIVITSTPTIKGVSVVDREYELSDRRVYLVPCPACQHEQELRWSNVVWDKSTDSDGRIQHDPASAAYACESCGVVIHEAEKRKMLARGRWNAEAPGRPTAGFRLNELYSPWSSWAKVVAEFLRSKDNPELLKVWTNTSLGETFEERGEAPAWELLFSKREKYDRGIVPPGGLVLVAGADVQKDRIEVEIVAYGPRLESWSIDYRTIQGDPETDAPWAKLRELLEAQFPRAAGGQPLRIATLALDTGYATGAAYAFARGQAGRVMAVKGKGSLPAALGAPHYVDINYKGKRIANGARLWPIGVDVLKKELYSWLRHERPEAGAETPIGLCHFPEGYDEEYFRQLTAEELKVTRKTGGGVRLEWVKARERNEALDVRVYARAAAAMLGLDRLTDSEWASLASTLAGHAPAAQPRPAGGPARRGRTSGGVRL